MTWQRIIFVHAVTHVVSDELAASLISEMRTRGHAVEDLVQKYGADFARAYGPNPKAVDRWGVDIGGACRKNRPIERFTIGGMPLDVPCEDLAFILRDLQRCQRRRFDDVALYYKLHTANCALVLTELQHASLLRQMTRRDEPAKQRAVEFDARTKGPAS